MIGIVFLTAWMVGADAYSYRDGYYYDSAGVKYSRSSYVSNGCTYYSYSAVKDYVPPAPKYVEPAKYEQKYDGSVESLVAQTQGDLIRGAVGIEKLRQTHAFIAESLHQMTGGRSVFRGYPPHYVGAGNAYTGDTRYATRSSVTYAEAYGKPIDLDGALARFNGGANNQVEAGREIQSRLADLIGKASDNQATASRSIAEADGVATKIAAMERLLGRFGEVLEKLDPPRQSVTTATEAVEQTPVVVPQSSGARFEPVAVPLLKKHCGECHDRGTDSKAGYVLDGQSSLGSVEVFRAISCVQGKPGVKKMPPGKVIPRGDIDGVVLELISLTGKGR